MQACRRRRFKKVVALLSQLGLGVLQARALLEGGADPALSNNEGYDALQYARGYHTGANAAPRLASPFCLVLVHCAEVSLRER